MAGVAPQDEEAKDKGRSFLLRVPEKAPALSGIQAAFHSALPPGSRPGTLAWVLSTLQGSLTFAPQDEVFLSPPQKHCTDIETSPFLSPKEREKSRLGLRLLWIAGTGPAMTGVVKCKHHTPPAPLWDKVLLSPSPTSLHRHRDDLFPLPGRERNKVRDQGLKDSALSLLHTPLSPTLSPRRG